MSTSLTTKEGTDDHESIIGLSRASIFGFFEDSIPEYIYVLFILMYLSVSAWIVYSDITVDKILNEAFTVSKRTKTRFYKALIVAVLYLVTEIVQSIRILQISRPNWVFYVTLFFGTFTSALFTTFLIDRDKDNRNVLGARLEHSEVRKIIVNIVREKLTSGRLGGTAGPQKRLTRRRSKGKKN